MTTFPEWLSPASVCYIAECLQQCESAAMIADLRSFVPPQALKKAVKRLSPTKHQQVRQWVELLNAKGRVAA
jgi:hypothetical protein